MVPLQLLRLDALLLGRGDVERHHRQHGAVHGHADAHLVERDAVEQRARVVDRVDRHAGHPDVAAHPRVVGVVAAVGRQVEGDAEALLTGREVAPVERVGRLGGREPGVLADRPGLGRVHRRVRAAQERAEPRPGVERVESLEVLGSVDAAGSRCPPGCANPDSSADPCDVPALAVADESVSGQAGEALGDAHASASLVRCRKARASTPIAHESSAHVARLARPRRPVAAPASRRAAAVSAPRLGVRRVGAGEADDRLAVVRRSSRRVRSDPGVTATPPAANRLVANVARAVCAATEPSVARKTGVAAGSSRSASNAAP